MNEMKNMKALALKFLGRWHGISHSIIPTVRAEIWEPRDSWSSGFFKRGEDSNSSD